VLLSTINSGKPELLVGRISSGRRSYTCTVCRAAGAIVGSSLVSSACVVRHRYSHQCGNAGIPGIDSGSLELNVENNVLTVKASRPRPQIEDSQWLVSERLRGTFTCQLHLSDGLDLDKIQVDCGRGVLTIRVPVAEGSRARRIEIGGSQTSGAESVAS
jgi:Hsp20/alpha crystallin family protein